MNSVSVLVRVAMAVVSTSIAALGSAAAPAKPTDSVAPLRSPEIVAIRLELGAVVQYAISGEAWELSGTNWPWRRVSAN